MTGSAHNAVLVTARSSLRWLEGESTVSAYTAPSGYYNVFCSSCGSPVPKLRGEKVYLVPAGSLDDDPGVRPIGHGFVGSMAAWHEISDELPQHDGRIPR